MLACLTVRVCVSLKPMFLGICSLVCCFFGKVILSQNKLNTNWNKIWEKWAKWSRNGVFWIFWKILSLVFSGNNLKWKMLLIIFHCKALIWQNYGPKYVPKCSQVIKLLYLLRCNISRKNQEIKLIWCMQINI